MGSKQSKDAHAIESFSNESYSSAPPPPPPTPTPPSLPPDSDEDNQEDAHSIVDVADDEAAETSSNRSSHRSSRRSSHQSSHQSSHRSSHQKNQHSHYHNGPLRRSKIDPDDTMSLGSSYLEEDEDWLAADTLFDHSCSDTDCSWQSDDSDYTSMFSLYEEDLQPTKWMRRFEHWLQGGDVEFHSSQEEDTDDDSNEDEDDENSRVSSKQRSALSTISEEEGSKTGEHTPARPSKYAIPEQQKVQVLHVEDYETEEDGDDDDDDNDNNDNDNDNDNGDNNETESYTPTTTRRRHAPAQPESDLAGLFQHKSIRKNKRKLLPVLTLQEEDRDMDDLSSIGSEDLPTLNIKPGSIPWSDLQEDDQSSWTNFGWNQENWDQIIQEKKDAEAHAKNLAGFRKHERKLRRAFRKQRRADRKVRRGIRDQRALRNKRGGGKLTAFQREEDPAQEDGMKVEQLIRRIMKRAEKEEEARKQKTFEETERRRKAKQAALGIQTSGNDEDAIKVKDMSLDLELRSRPWNSRSHADRSEILYQTLFRPFTKNV